MAVEADRELPVVGIVDRYVPVHAVAVAVLVFASTREGREVGEDEVRDAHVAAPVADVPDGEKTQPEIRGLDLQLWRQVVSEEGVGRRAGTRQTTTAAARDTT